MNPQHEKLVSDSLEILDNLSKNSKNNFLKLSVAPCHNLSHVHCHFIAIMEFRLLHPDLLNLIQFNTVYIHRSVNKPESAKLPPKLVERQNHVMYLGIPTKN